MFYGAAAYARGGDPDTSHAAAEFMRGERANRYERLVLEALEVLGPSTQNEVVEFIGGGPWYQSITPRFKPLEKKGLIRRTGQIRKNESGRNAQLWTLNNEEK